MSNSARMRLGMELTDVPPAMVEAAKVVFTSVGGTILYRPCTVPAMAAIGLTMPNAP